MGNKSSKSVNISTPKGDTAVDENNHVGNGDSGKPDGTRILEVILARSYNMHRVELL